MSKTYAEYLADLELMEERLIDIHYDQALLHRSLLLETEMSQDEVAGIQSKIGLMHAKAGLKAVVKTAEPNFMAFLQRECGTTNVDAIPPEQILHLATMGVQLVFDSIRNDPLEDHTL